jgi:tetratricopeptide (TPR) repeat protein
LSDIILASIISSTISSIGLIIVAIIQIKNRNKIKKYETDGEKFKSYSEKLHGKEKKSKLKEVKKWYGNGKITLLQKNAFNTFIKEGRVELNDMLVFDNNQLKGKEVRTQYIAKKLNECLYDPPNSITIYEQAGLSTFSISPDPNEPKKNPNYYSENYFRLLTKQQEAFHNLVDKKNNKIRIIIDPYYELTDSDKIKRKIQGIQDVIKRMEYYRDDNNVDWIIKKFSDYYNPPIYNRLIIDKKLYIESEEIKDSGYSYSKLEKNRENVEKAIEDFEKIFSIAQKDFKTKDDVINTLKEHLKAFCQEKREHYEESVKLEPENSLYLNELGSILHEIGEYKKALEYYEKALPIANKLDKRVFGNSHIAIILNNIGSACHELGKYEEALENYENAFKNFTQFLGKDHFYTKTVKRTIEDIKPKL